MISEHAHRDRISTSNPAAPAAPDRQLPKLADLGGDLCSVSVLRRALGIVVPFVAVVGCLFAATRGLWWIAVPLVPVYVFSSYTSVSHDLVHRTLGLPRWLGDALLSLIEILGLRSGTAYRLAHLHHHRVFPDPEDIEAYDASGSVSGALVAGVIMQPRQWLWAYRRYPRHRLRLLAELAVAVAVVGTAIWAWDSTPVFALYFAAVIVASWALPLATTFFVHRPGEKDPLRQTRLFRGWLLHVLFLGHLYHLEHHLYPSVPHHNWAKLARRIDPYLRAVGVAPVNLRTGEEELPDPSQAVPKCDGTVRFWIDYWLTFFVFIPVIAVRQVQITCQRILATIATYNRTVSLLGGRLEIVYVNNLRSLIVSVLFGERFQAVRYGDKLIDPGPPFAARRVSRYLDGIRSRISAVLVTHSHEEHFANAGRASRQLRVPVFGSNAALNAIRRPERISLMRAMMIGQPRADAEVTFAGTEALDGYPTLVPLSSDGHCAGHLSFYDADRKILFVGDSFMHEIFTSPNSEVDSHVWIETMKRYAALDIKTMVGSHGELTTVDDEIPNVQFVVDRRDPQELIARKLAFMEWALEVVRIGEERGLPYSVIEASLFPWSRTWSWKNFFVDEGARLLSGGEFSRTHLVRSLASEPHRVPHRFFGPVRRFRAGSFRRQGRSRA